MEGRQTRESGARPGAADLPTRMPPRPLVVVEGSAEVIQADVRRLREAGFDVVEGFRGGPPPRATTARAGVVATPAEAADALLAALAGAAVVIATAAPRELVDRLVDDLRRLGPVDHRVGGLEPAPLLDPEARAILGLLAEGHSLGEAAGILGLARRTADRRLLAARRSLGVDRTTEAVAQGRRLGLFGQARRPRDEAGR
jgi:DNA-binding CsgD family transcriptional regulator